MELYNSLVNWCRSNKKIVPFVSTILFVLTVYAGQNIDNIRINSNTVSSINTNGNIILDPNGTGKVRYNDLTASRVPYLDANKDLVVSSITPTELGYLTGTTANISNVFTGDSGSGGVKGLVPAPAAGDATKFLRGDATWQAASGGSSIQNVESISSTNSTDTSNQIVLLSGASFTLTLHTAVGNTGQVMEIIHSGTSLTQLYTLNTTSSQTIGGIASGAYVLYTNREKLKIVSDGSNWIILDHVTETGWIDAGAVTITATTTNPTKPTTMLTDTIRWKRLGDTALFEIVQNWGSAAGSAAGSGGYRWSLPSNMTGVPVLSSDATGTENETAASNVGTSSFIVEASSQAFYPAHATSTTSVGVWAPGTGRVGSGHFALNNANMGYTIRFQMKISGWQP